MRTIRTLLHLLLVGLVLASLTLPLSQLATPEIAQAQGTDAAVPLLVNTVTSDWTLANPRLIWLTYPECPARPPSLADVSPQAAGDPVTISRVSTNGSQARQLFSRNDPRAPGVCNPYKPNSNIVADENYIYWVDGTQLVRLSVAANPGDAPEPWGPTFFNAQVELFMARDYVLTLQKQDCDFCLLGTRFNLVSKADASSISNLQLFEFGNSPKYDGKYIYYKDATNALQRFLPGDNPEPTTIAEKVGEYLPEGEATLCNSTPTQINCFTTSYVFYTRDDTIGRFNNIDGQRDTIYNSFNANRPAGQVARLYGLALGRRSPAIFGGRNLFFFEKRYVPCPVPPGCFVTAATDLLRTISWSGGAPTDLYFRDTDTAHSPKNLSSDGSNLYWSEQQVEGPTSPSTVWRLPTDAAALPRINLTVTGLEITQGIQRSNNTVPLIQLRPTFVRVFARATGQSVPNVTAQLQVSAAGLGTATLSPVNPDVGSRIRVLVNPSRGVTNDSFIFELPWEYTRVPDLRLRATVNPFGVPLEPTLADNTLNAGPFAFNSTPRLNVTFVEFNFRLNNTDYKPQGTYKNVNWIRRVYPLGASIGANGWNYGLNYNVWQIDDAGLAARVNRQSPECDAYVKRKSDGTIEKDDREFCASDYVNGLLRDLRSRRSVPEGTFLYGEIPDTGVAGQFPRGQEGGSSVSSGPDGTAWDGFYAGHEIGHSLGLGHPKSADGSCGLQGSDPQPPHANGRIGPGDSSIVGFDSRDGTFGGKRAVLPDGSWFDMMAYCQPQWISDVNYERIYKRLTGQAAIQQATPLQEGDWLSVYGSIDVASQSAAVSLVRRLAGSVVVPERVAGDYALRLLDVAGTQVADYPFTPEAGDDDERASFGLVVPFADGARQLQIVRVSTGAVLFSQAISASPPGVSGVGLQGAADPASGVVTLAWNASDPDGDALRYEVLFSRDGGTSFEPLLHGLTSPSAAIDTAQVGGGSVIFRVVASDGVQSAEADSPAVNVAPQPPQPQILAPLDGSTLEWGQLVNLRGEALDAQDGSVASSGLAWSNQNGPLGTGPQLAIANLPVGANVITLTATNSAGVSSSTSIRLTVGDDLDEPGPILEASPAAISWNVEPGASAPLSATLTLNNVGGGTLSWTATSNAPWLTLSSSSGGEGQGLTVTADPSSLAANTTTTAQITIQTAGIQPVQTITVPVSIFVGNPGFGPPPDTRRPTELRLPVIMY